MRPKQEPQPLAVSVRKAAILLDCSMMSVRRLVKSGKLGSFLVGSDLRIPIEDIHSLVAESRRQAA